jgi:hypothetical protein
LNSPAAATIAPYLALMSVDSESPRNCPDGGRCHHLCQGAECFRVRRCEPLSGVYDSDDAWPEWLRQALCSGDGGREAEIVVAAEELVRSLEDLAPGEEPDLGRLMEAVGEAQ